MLRLDMQQVLYFLGQLEKDGRHTIASEAPFGRNGLPRWEPGATYEHSQRPYLMQDIANRQERGSNIYYSVNRPCKATNRQGAYGKNNIDDIIAIRALAFDIDVLEPQEQVLDALKKKLDGELLPSIIVYTGGGYHLIYLLNELIYIRLHRPPKNDEEKATNDIIIKNRMAVTALSKDFEIFLRGMFSNWKIDNMSNIDRVMRLPGTINFPKREKVAKGQRPALARIIFESQHKTNIHQLRQAIPEQSSQQPHASKAPFRQVGKTSWTGYKKAKACCEFIREKGLADSNEIYTLNVMLPLIGAIHDENEYNNITLEEAEELFILAISGGERYNTLGRTDRYFMRQWRSHRPELPRNGTKSLGGLIYFCKENGMQLPWASHIIWEESFQKQLDAATSIISLIDGDVIDDLSSYQD